MSDPLKYIRHRERPLKSRWIKPTPPIGGPPPPAPEHDLIITTRPGYTTPDCIGFYDLAGEYNGRPYYRRTDEAYVLYWQMPMEFGVIDINFSFAVPFWIEDDYSLYPLGTYAPGNESIGWALASWPA